MARDTQHQIDAGHRARRSSIVDDHSNGYSRRATASGFRYIDNYGKPLKDEATLARIKGLAIPPAWTEVWICPSPRGHIQAVGRDQKGRKQYRYHPDWRADRDLQKFERMAAFGRALPRLRKRVEADLARRGLPREKVLAAVVRLLELTLIRVGNEEYAKHQQELRPHDHAEAPPATGQRRRGVRVSRQERQGPQDRLPGQAPGADRPGLPGAARPAPVQISR
jgi:DNA topoisomerase-1